MRAVKNPDFRITKLEHAKNIMRGEIQQERSYIESMMPMLSGRVPLPVAAAINAAEKRIKQWQHCLALLADVTEV
jgi:hypothetical protein